MPFPIVGVGASAGGMEAFIDLLRQLPQNTGMAFVLIQHLDPTHASYLSEALARTTSLPVSEIQHGMRVQPDHVYVMPSNADVGIVDGALTLSARSSAERKPHLPIDFFFKALAVARRNQAIGIVLSGSGSDGSEGLCAIKAEDGVACAQDPQSAKFSAMPEAAIRTGVVDFVLPIPELAQELVRIGRHPFMRGREAEVPSSAAEEGELKQVLALLRDAMGVDFSEYKPTSIRRRLARRMALLRLTKFQEYVRLLEEDKAEARALFGDILIHVTSFFRDAAVFEKLKERVFPEILKRNRERGGSIRIWCAGCSSGEEAYSIVISLLEFLAAENASDVPIQLFGSDISERAIERARAGVYPESAARDVGAERLARFFARVEGGGYRISKAVRDRCAFVKHDLASDPPFSKLDLVSCRNVLIYFGPELQKRALATFQFALNQPGFLMLGHAEGIAVRNDLFSVVDKEHRMFARSAAKSTLRLAPARDVFPVAPPPAAGAGAGRVLSSADVVRRTESCLLDQYAPPGVIVNERMEILHFRGRTGPYLEPAPGQPQHDLLKMARKGLLAELRIAISQAKKANATVRRTGVRIEQEGATRSCNVIVIPVVSPPESREHVFAVLFEDAESPVERADTSKRRRPPRPAARSEERRVEKLETELVATNEHLQSIIEERERTNEELVSASEELVSSNEELQSLNEELETAKEELQSTNEELSTLNEELQTRNAELNSVNSDLVNILGSVEVPIVIVDASRRIRRFTPKARPILNLLPSDVGRPIDDIKPALAIDNLDQKIAEVIDTVTMREEEAQGRDGRWHRLQIRPYTTVDGKIDGAVLSIIDIDVLKRALSAAEWSRDYAKATVEAVQTPLLVLDRKLSVLSANEAFHDKYALPRAEADGRMLYELMNGAWDIPELRLALERVREGNERFQRLIVERDLPLLGLRSVSLSGRAVSTPSGERTVLLAAEDITERLRGEAERAGLLEEARAAKASAEDANRTKDVFLATLSHELRTPLSSLLLQAQLLRRGTMDEAKLRKAGALIERATKAQAQLIDDLLDISRIVAGKLKMELQAVNLASIVEVAVDTVGPSAEKKQLAVEVHLDDTRALVWGDPVRLQQVISNLLTNAVKFTPERGRVTVIVDAAKDLGRIRVTDTGSGIAPDFLPHIFDRFSQEDRGQTRTQGGLGLGLAIVRYLVESHGGNVHAESAGKGAGSTFTVLLPLMHDHAKRAEISGAELAPEGTATRSVQNVRVLVVEDDPGTRETLTEMLGLSGFDVRSTEAAAPALKIVEEFRPELMICDIGMPDEDGYSLMRRIRALGPNGGGDVPALALTALAGEEDRRRAFAAGFQQHLAKPVDIDRLVAALRTLLSQNAPLQLSLPVAASRHSHVQ